MLFHLISFDWHKWQLQYNANWIAYTSQTIKLGDSLVHAQTERNMWHLIRVLINQLWIKVIMFVDFYNHENTHIIYRSIVKIYTSVRFKD